MGRFRTKKISVNSWLAGLVAAHGMPSLVYVTTLHPYTSEKIIINLKKQADMLLLLASPRVGQGTNCLMLAVYNVEPQEDICRSYNYLTN